MTEAIKKIQRQLGVNADGIFGRQSYAALAQATQNGKQIKITENWFFSELIKSDTAARHGIDNMPSLEHTQHLIEACVNLWQPIRDLLGVPVSNSCAYRSPRVNALIKGASKTSVHMVGYAMDMTAPRFGSPTKIAQFLSQELHKRGVKFDQLILEYPDHANGGWVHVGYKSNAGLQRGRLTLKLTGQAYREVGRF